MVFRFEGEFKYVYRELSRRRTDDIEIVSAEMDGRTLSFGNESGQVEVRRRSKVRVEWKFAPRADSSHTFVLTYIVRGVVQRDGGRDVLEWVALPTEHDYRIGETQVSLELPVAPLSRPIVDSKRVAELTFEPGGQQLQVFARGIGKNGWVKTRLEFGEGAIIAAAPAWQQRQLAARALAPRWLTAAGIILVAGLLFMFALRQSYDSPWGTAHAGPVDAPPDTLRPAMAGAVAANGGTTLQHAMATIFALAERGVVTITEEPRKWGQRHFTLHRRRATHPLAPEEDAALNVAFRHKGAEEDAVALTKARTRLAGRLGDFKRAVKQELRGLGLVDDERMRLRARYLGFSIAFLILAGLLVVPAALPRLSIRGLAVSDCGRGRTGVGDWFHLLRFADATVERRRATSRTLAGVPEAPQGCRARARAPDDRLAVPAAAIRGRARPRQRVVEVHEESSNRHSTLVPRARGLRR